VKNELRIFATFAASVVVCFALSLIMDGHLPTNNGGLVLIVILLAAVVILLWRMLRLLYGIADKLGFNAARTERISALFKKTEPYSSANLKLTEEEKKEIFEELGELTNFDWNQEPAKISQMVRIIERLQNITALLAAKENPPPAY
jgi:Tfp pilus assembly protein PilO